MKRTDPAPPPTLTLRLTASGVWWLVAAALIGALAWYKSINQVLILVYAMTVLVALNGVAAWAAVRRATAVRLPTSPVFPGERAACGVRVSNGAGHAVTVSVTDRAGGSGATVLVYRLPAGRSLDCSVVRSFPGRGRFGGPVTVSSAFPFGLLECVRPGEPGGDILVLPPAGAAEPDGLRRWARRHAAGGGRTRRVTADQGEVRGVRPYRPGDTIRDVHWRSTARRGALMVREYDATPAPALVLVIEPWLPAAPTAADRGRLEAALSLAVTVALTWRRTFDSPVTVAVPGGEVVTAASEDHLRAALAPLADVAGGETAEPVSGGSLERHLAHSARVVVSSRPNTPYAAALARATGTPFLAVSPADPLPWYHPPEAVTPAGAGPPTGGGE